MFGTIGGSEVSKYMFAKDQSPDNYFAEIYDSFLHAVFNITWLVFSLAVMIWWLFSVLMINPSFGTEVKQWIHKRTKGRD
jgi:hypothetical protein